MPSNGKISVLSTGNRKVTAEADPAYFPYGGYRNGICLSLNGKLKNKEKTVVKYKVKAGSKTYTLKTTVTFLRSQSPVQSITVNGKKCGVYAQKVGDYLATKTLSGYQVNQKGIDPGTPAKVNVKLKSAYKLAKIQVETLAEPTDRTTSWKTIRNGATVTTGVYGVRVFYYTKLPVNFKSSYYKREANVYGHFDSRAAAEYQQEKKDFARYRCATYYCQDYFG